MLCEPSCRGSRGGRLKEEQRSAARARLPVFTSIGRHAGTSSHPQSRPCHHHKVVKSAFSWSTYRCIVQARYQQHQHPSAGRATALINHRLDSIPSHPGYSSLYIVEMPSSCLPNANATSNPNYRAVLQEILSSAAAPGWHGAAMIGHGAEDLELLLQVFA